MIEHCILFHYFDYISPIEFGNYKNTKITFIFAYSICKVWGLLNEMEERASLDLNTKNQESLEISTLNFFSYLLCFPASLTGPYYSYQDFNKFILNGSSSQEIKNKNYYFNIVTKIVSAFGFYFLGHLIDNKYNIEGVFTNEYEVSSLSSKVSYFYIYVDTFYCDLHHRVQIQDIL